MGERRGHLVIIGGAEDREDDKAVLSTVAELAGGKDGRIVVLTTASRQADEEPEVAREFAELYERAFTGCGVGEVRTLHIHDRRGANEPEHATAVRAATGVFMTGGDQSRLVSILGGSAVHRAMRAGFARGGACIAGTSAGASAMSRHMPLGGPSEPVATKGMLPVAPGLGFLRNVVLDQHFSQRGRLARLLSVCAQNPFLLGVGIDEDTGLVVQPGVRLEVVGSGGVTVLDGRDMVYTNFNEVGRGEALAITDVRLHLLPTGFRFDVKTGVEDDARPKRSDDLNELMCTLMAGD
jgi:cyanophycinase